MTPLGGKCLDPCAPRIRTYTVRYAMGQEESDKGHSIGVRDTKSNDALHEDFALEKSIFNNIFEKDIRRVFVYKKAERLAKAIHLIAPAFSASMSLRNRMDAVAIGLIDAAILPPGAARPLFSRELLVLSSLLSIARTSGFLSSMNADLISREAHILLQEVAMYEEPRLSLTEAPTLSSIAKKALPREQHRTQSSAVPKGHIKDRSEAILSVIRDKGAASIKDISTLIRNVSEKTIQRELLTLIVSGKVRKQGERRWSTYLLV